MYGSLDSFQDKVWLLEDRDQKAASLVSDNQGLGDLRNGLELDCAALQRPNPHQAHCTTPLSLSHSGSITVN